MDNQSRQFPSSFEESANFRNIKFALIVRNGNTLTRLPILEVSRIFSGESHEWTRKRNGELMKRQHLRNPKMTDENGTVLEMKGCWTELVQIGLLLFSILLSNFMLQTITQQNWATISLFRHNLDIQVNRFFVESIIIYFCFITHKKNINTIFVFSILLSLC